MLSPLARCFKNVLQKIRLLVLAKQIARSLGLWGFSDLESDGDESVWLGSGLCPESGAGRSFLNAYRTAVLFDSFLCP